MKELHLPGAQIFHILSHGLKQIVPWKNQLQMLLSSPIPIKLPKTGV